MFLSENLQEKWEPILEHSDLPSIEDNYKKAVTAVILENQEKALAEEELLLKKLHLLMLLALELVIGTQS